MGNTGVEEVALGGIWLVFRAELRRRWRSWLAIAVLISIVGGFVLAAAAAGRRTESAFPRFVAAHGFDVVVYANEPQPMVAKLPGVAAVSQLASPYNGQPTCHCTRPIDPSNLDIVSVTGRVLLPPRLRSPTRPGGSRPSAGVVHDGTGLWRATRDCDPCPALRVVATLGAQQLHRRRT